MSSIMKWLGLKTPQQRTKEARRYDKWAFPYGPAPKEKVVALLGKLLPEEKRQIALGRAGTVYVRKRPPIGSVAFDFWD